MARRAGSECLVHCTDASMRCNYKHKSMHASSFVSSAMLNCTLACRLLGAMYALDCEKALLVWGSPDCLVLALYIEATQQLCSVSQVGPHL
jgi:hypothetical protein